MPCVQSGSKKCTATQIKTFTSASPTLVTPNLGTPSAGTLTSATGLPISTGLTGAGTGVLTALGVNVGSAGAFVTFNGALGTPSSGTLTNATGLPIAGTTGYGTGVATALAGNVTGSGGIVLATSPTLVTPAIGVASATSVNKLTITAPATGSTLTIADGKTTTVSNTLTFTGTDGSSVAFGAGGTVSYLATAGAFTKQQNFSPIATVTDASTIAWDVSVAQVGKVTIGATGRTLTPSNIVSGGTYILYIVQDGTGSRTITTYTNIRWPGGTLPTLSTAAGAIDMISCTSIDGTHLECVFAGAFS